MILEDRSDAKSLCSDEPTESLTVMLPLENTPTAVGVPEML